MNPSNKPVNQKPVPRRSSGMSAAPSYEFGALG